MVYRREGVELSEKLIECVYFNKIINRNNKKKNNKFNHVKITVLDEREKVISNCTKKYKNNKKNIKNIIKALNIVIDTLEEIKLKNYISHSDKVIIYSRDKLIETILKGNYYSSSYREIEFIKYKLRIHNFRIKFDLSCSKKIKEISKEKDFMQIKFNNSKKRKTTKNLDKVSDFITNGFEQMIFFDLEMNCNDYDTNNGDWQSISLGAVKVSKEGEILDLFYSLIRPKNFTSLSKRCINITKLTNDEIELGLDFSTVMNNFKEWAGNKRNIYVSWGIGDLKSITSDAKLNKYNDHIIHYIKKNYVNFQKEFSKYYANMNDALALRDVVLLFYDEFIGNQHHALYDTINMVNIYKSYLNDINSNKNHINIEENKCLYLGKNYTIRLIKSNIEKAKYLQGKILIYSNSTKTTKKYNIIEKWYIERCQKICKEIIDKYAKLLDFKEKKHPIVTVNNMSDKWTRIIKRRNLIFVSYDLVLLPKMIIEYILFNSLLSLLTNEVNFKKYYNNIMPDWKDRQAILDNKIKKKVS